MIVRVLVAAGLLLATSVSGVAAEPDNGHGHGRGHDDQRASSSSSVLSTRLATGQTSIVVTLPGAGSANAALACSSEPNEWAKALQNTDWVSPLADCTAAQPGGNYRYDSTFTVPTGTTGLILSGAVLSDDSVVSVVLNGHTLALSDNGGFTAPSTFATSDQSFFQAGTNTFSITVDNISGPTGLDFQLRVRSDGASGSDDGGADNDNHGQCVSDVAHSTRPGPGHGDAVSEAAHGCD